MTKRIQFVALALAALLALTGCSMIAVDPVKDAAEPVIQVNKETLTKGDLQEDFNYSVAYNAWMYSLYNYSMSPEQIADTIRQSFVDSYVESILAAQKGAELGLDQFDAETEAAFQEEVESGWADYLTSVESRIEGADEMTDEEKTAAEIAYLEENGTTRELYEETQRKSKVQELVREFVIKDVAVTDDEIQAAYDERVSADETSYTDNAMAFEQAVTYGTTVAWRPEGYRTVLHILLKYDDERDAQITELNTRLTELEGQIEEAAANGGQIVVEAAEDVADAAESALDDAADTLEEAVVEAEEIVEEVSEEVEETVETVEEALEETVDGDATDTVETEEAEQPAGTVITLDELVSQQADVQAQIAQIQADFLAEKQAVIDEIMEKLEGGAQFRDLIEEYSEDTGMQPGTTSFENGYYVSAGSQMWEQGFIEGAMALEKVGDVSGAVYTSNGIHLIFYNSDVQSGPVSLDELREEIESDLLSTKQDETYAAAVEEWKNAATIKTWPDRLQYTGN